MKKTNFKIILGVIFMLILSIFYYLHLLGTGLIFNIALTMQSSDVAGGTFVATKSIIVPCEQLHQLFPEVSNVPTASTQPQPIDGSGLFERYTKFSKTTLNLGESALTTTQKWAISAASEQPVCVKSIGNFLKEASSISKK
jgi:hypothetical protein